MINENLFIVTLDILRPAQIRGRMIDKHTKNNLVVVDRRELDHMGLLNVKQAGAVVVD